MNVKAQSVTVSFVVVAVVLCFSTEARSQAKKAGLTAGAKVKISGRTARFVIPGTSGTWMPDGSGFHVFKMPSEYAEPPRPTPSLESVDLEKLSRKEIPAPNPKGTYFGVTFSPDGSRFAYTVTTGTAKEGTIATSVWVGGAGLESPLQLTSDFEDENPSWSPDGTALVFDRKIRIEVASSAPKSSSPSSGWRGRSQWQKGSSGWLAAGGFRMQAQFIYASGGHPHPLCPWVDHVEQPIWSPTGKAIAFLSDHDTEPDDGMHLWVADPADPECKSAKRVSKRRTGGKGEGGANEGDTVFAWSPDGSKLAFTVNHPSADGIWVVNADGSDRKQLVAHAEVLAGLSWSFDSQLLAVQVKADVPGTTEKEDTVSVLDLSGKEVWRFAEKRAKKDKQCAAIGGHFSPKTRLLAIMVACEPAIAPGLWVVDLR